MNPLLKLLDNRYDLSVGPDPYDGWRATVRDGDFYVSRIFRPIEISSFNETYGQDILLFIVEECIKDLQEQTKGRIKTDQNKGRLNLPPVMFKPDVKIVPQNTPSNRWIPVTERLPKGPEYDWVLVQTVILGREPYYGVPHIAELRNGIWYCSEFSEPMEEILAIKVTHWMPLPNFPEEPIIPGPKWMINEYISDDIKTEEPSEHKPITVNYICDKRACSNCHPASEFMGCAHTSDVRHAKNFKLIDGEMFEKTIIHYYQSNPLYLEDKEPSDMGKSIYKITEALNKLISRQRPKNY